MDWSSEKYPWSYLLPGFALVFAWGVISLAHVHERSLASVNDSFTRGFMVPDGVDGILDDLARLRDEQEAFLSTGEARFQDGVVESAEAATLHMAMLNSVAAKNKMQSPHLGGLLRSIDQVLAAMDESNQVAVSRGKAAAAEFFESKESAISEARWHANQLKTAITAGISDRIRDARSTRAFFHDLFYLAQPGIGRENGARRILIGRVSAVAVGP